MPSLQTAQPETNRMRISLIVAISQNNVIGKDNQLPWHLPADLRHFKQLTMGHPIIMGRNTYESIGRPLPGRRSIVLSRSAEFALEGCETATSLTEAIQLCEGADEAFVIGGAKLFEEAAQRSDRIYLTRIHAECEGDTFFPAINWDTWSKIDEMNFSADSKNQFAYSFQTFDRK